MFLDILVEQRGHGSVEPERILDHFGGQLAEDSTQQLDDSPGILNGALRIVVRHGGRGHNATISSVDVGRGQLPAMKGTGIDLAEQCTQIA